MDNNVATNGFEKRLQVARSVQEKILTLVLSTKPNSVNTRLIGVPVATIQSQFGFVTVPGPSVMVPVGVKNVKQPPPHPEQGVRGCGAVVGGGVGAGVVGAGVGAGVGSTEFQLSVNPAAVVAEFEVNVTIAYPLAIFVAVVGMVLPEKMPTCVGVRHAASTQLYILMISRPACRLMSFTVNPIMYPGVVTLHLQFQSLP